MNTYMNETTLNAVNEALDNFRHHVRPEVCSTVFCKRFDYAYEILTKRLDSIMADVWSASHVGYCSHDEAVGIYGDIQRMRLEAHGFYYNADKERLGEREFSIQHDIYKYGMTREEAERAFDEDWE